MLCAFVDIHGELEKLDELLELTPLAPGDRLVFLGDYIDRGPDSPGVIVGDLPLEAECVFRSATTSRCFSTSWAGPTTRISAARHSF